MIDFRPVGYVVGLLVFGLGLLMIPPAILDAFAQNGEWRAFVISSMLTVLIGGGLALGCVRGRGAGLTIEQAFLLTVLSWVALPLFGALPFMLGPASATVVDAVFEAVSGITTTGATVFERLHNLPPGILLWRALLQWIGGVGIVVFALAFLPTLQVGGMQLFRSEAFDTYGKILPRATLIASSIFSIYLALTLICAMVYGALGMDAFDALCHAMTTIATGGFANYDESFAAFNGGAQYAAVLFMLASSLPFVRYVQLVNGSAEPLLQDQQIRGFAWIAGGVILTICGVRLLAYAAGATENEAGVGLSLEQVIRSAVFNSVSILTGTGYASANYNEWGGFLVSVFFIIGLIGGCAGSTCCSVKVFRYQVLAAMVRAEMKRIRRPHGVFTPRYEGRAIKPDVVSSVLAFFFMFVVSLGLLTATLSWVGLDTTTALSGAASALANIGPGLGDKIGPVGNYADLPNAAKMLLSFGMLLGRLEILSLVVLFTPGFWSR